MTTEKYRIFLSSGMEEFKNERIIIKHKLDNYFSTFVYEEDAGARTQTIRDTYIKELLNCDLYIGIFGTGYGEHTIDEFRSARAKNIPCLIYEKVLTDAETRDKELTKFIDEISGVESKDGLTICRFSSLDDLIFNIERDLGRWVKSRDGSIATTSDKPKLETSSIFYCDRVRQTSGFDEIVKRKIKFFIIDGAKKQSHKSLVKRFSFEESNGGDVKKPISVEDVGSVVRLKFFIQKELYRVIAEKPSPGDISFSSLAKSILPENYGKVFVVFRMDDELLLNKTILEGMDWFSNEYCSEESLPDGSPDFYFFLMIRYSESNAKKKRVIQKQLNKFQHYYKLDELEDVKKKDLEKWIIRNEITAGDIDLENV